MSWQTVPLGKLAVSRAGSVNPAKFSDETFELFSIPAYDDGTAEVCLGASIGSSKKCVEENDILLSRIVPHIRRSWVVGPSKGFRQIASGEWIQFRSPEIYPGYLRHFLTSDPFHNQFMRTVSGVGGSLLRARPTEVYKIAVPLPPLEEQKRIANILDAADTLRAKCRESLAQLDELLQSTFFEFFGDPVSNAKGLKKSTLKDVFEFQTGKLDSNAAVSGGKYPFFTCARETSEIDNYAFDCKALLLAGNNANADYSVKYYDGKFNAYQRTYVITLNEGIIKYEYAKCALELMLKDLKRFSKGSNTKYLTLVILNRMPILLPELELQNRFVEVYRAIERQKAMCLAHFNELSELLSSLQSRAFSGEL